MTKTKVDICAHYKRGDDLQEDIKRLQDFGHINEESGKFIFDACDSCGGQKLGHITESSSCTVKPKMAKASKEWIEDMIQDEANFESSLAKMDT